MPGGVRAVPAAAIRAWDGTKWVTPKYNVGSSSVPNWRGYGDAGVTFLPHMNDTFGGVGDDEWAGSVSATTPDGDGYIYNEQAGLNSLGDVLQPVPAAQNVGKLARIEVVVRAEFISGLEVRSLYGYYFEFEVWDTYGGLGTTILNYQSPTLSDISDTGWITYKPFDVYMVASGVPEFHKARLYGPTDQVVTRVSLSRWTVLDVSTDAVMGYEGPSTTEMIPNFWNGVAWVPQTMI